MTEKGNMITSPIDELETYLAEQGLYMDEHGGLHTLSDNNP